MLITAVKVGSSKVAIWRIISKQFAANLNR